MSAERLQIRVVGIVQGVGFRPFVYRLAQQLLLCGWVRNDGDGVTIELEGDHARLLEFGERLARERPAASILYAVDHRWIAPQGDADFQIVPSGRAGAPRAWVLPDLATCDACRAEVLDPGNRRYRYPFTNCTHCGPRFTILAALPYDRPNTSMAGFPMCARCRAEYDDPGDRRFHAQPNACPDCGPRLRCVNAGGEVLGEADAALRLCEQAIRAGQIVALKGLGGFHIVVDARNEPAVGELRRRKGRPYKPLAVMFPDLPSLRAAVEVPSFAEPLLADMQAPIVLLPRRAGGTGRAGGAGKASAVAAAVAPGSPRLGVFLPYTPLHLLLMHDLGFPVVATSGNLTDQPTLHEDDAALTQLASLCDVFLLHDRPILRQADDSVVQVVERPLPRAQLLRRARGYTPLPVLAPRELPAVLALGGEMNAVFALARGREVILSQHLGELETVESQDSYRRILSTFLRLYGVRPQLVAHDLHPDYFTTRLARELDLPRVAVQHHHAHLAACLLENQVEGPALGITWDGTGFGPDGTVWGGEFLLGDARAYRRVATLHPFRLPGSVRAIEQTWRTGLSLLWETYGEDVAGVLPSLPLASAVPPGEIDRTLQLLRRGVHAPMTTSVGRLFDGVSALLGLSYENTHQAQSPQLLEAAAWRHDRPAPLLPLPVLGGDPARLDWRPLVRALVDGLREGTSPEALAAAFHQALVEAAVAVVRSAAPPQVALAGGVFCNRYLTEALLARLAPMGLPTWSHSLLPPTDGSLAAGQLWVAAHAASGR